MVTVGALLALAGNASAARVFSATPGHAIFGRYSPVGGVLPDGRVLIVGGNAESSTVIKGAELFDPATGTYSGLPAEALEEREEAPTVRLPDGRLLFVGGYGAKESLTSLELFNPATMKFEAVAAHLATARDGAAAVLLPSGKVLIFDGAAKGAYPTGMETYDPATGKVETVAGGPLTTRYQAGVAVLPDGRVLIAGGYVSPPGTFYKGAEILDPSTGVAVALTGPGQEMSVALPNGKVLLIGGYNTTATDLSTIEAFNPASDTFEAAGSLLQPRDAPLGVLLPDGRVFVTGGFDETVPKGERYLTVGELSSVPGPAAAGTAASAIGPTSATLNGTVLSDYLSTVFFRYGTTAAYGTSTAVQSGPPGTAPVAVAASVTGLAPNTTYHFALVSEGLGGSSVSADQTFTTALGMPAISAAKQSHRSWREGSKAARITRAKSPVGTIFSFVLNEPAAVKLAFTQPGAGRRVGGRCVARTKSAARHRACRRVVTVGTLSLAGHTGLNKVAFQGRISHAKKLRPGTYTLLLSATAVGLHSSAAKLTFTITG